MDFLGVVIRAFATLQPFSTLQSRVSKRKPYLLAACLMDMVSLQKVTILLGLKAERSRSGVSAVFSIDQPLLKRFLTT